MWAAMPRPLLVAVLVLMLLTACGIHADPPPSIPITAYSGSGDLMAKCMQYASESYCEREILGGNSR